MTILRFLGSENDHLHRRHTDPGGRCQNSTGTHRVHDLPAGELGTNGQQREIPDEPNSAPAKKLKVNLTLPLEVDQTTTMYS